ncbi:MAG TPA: PDZ domain-containing protein [Candidatus Hydrogenedentes bacterium]|nr:PDZ domain-containing protein [Candidatus Hydrogenedentota bacterium]HOV73050.1 PDZ domain-containing protein [Candidatus Hydrogenedentota bacterium]
MSSSVLALMAVVAQFMPADGFTQATIAKAYAEWAPAVALVQYSSEITDPGSGETTKRDSSALGLVVTPGGLVMAPGHMQLENAEPFNVAITVGHGGSERKFEAEVLKKPDDINICFLRIQSDTPLNLPCATFARNMRLSIGEPVLLIGLYSENLDYARGIYTCRIGGILEKPRTTYCIDSTLRFGFVGGPVINAQGRLVGVVGFDLTPAEGGDLYVRSGHPLVYQADLFRKYIETPPDKTAEGGPGGEDAWLGIFTQPLYDDFAEYWNIPKEGGIVVSSVMAGSPAEKAGLKAGDVIVSINSVGVHPRLDREVVGFTKLVREIGVGQTVPLRVLREGKPLDLEITLAARPKSARDAGEYKDEVFGLTVRELTTDVRILLNLGEDVKGVIIRRVKSGSIANLAGMRPGVVIMELGRNPIATLDDFKKAVTKLVEEKPKEVSAFCRVGAETGFFRLEPRWDAMKR